MNGLDLSEIIDTANTVQAEIESLKYSKEEYRAEIDASIIETRDIIQKMAYESERESKHNRIMNLVTIVIASLTLFVTVISLFR